MPRPPRPQLPGTAYHVTARTQGKALFFTPHLRSTILEILTTSLCGTDVKLLAIAIMSNHMHLVLQQGWMSLGRVLQPSLTRIARHVQKVHKVEGHVFGRRYYAQPITDPAYLRAAIVYVHLNPVRAGICVEPRDYAWTSHELYAHGKARQWPDPKLSILFPLDATLQLFATGPSRTNTQLRRDYRSYINARLHLDRARDEDRSESLHSELPLVQLYYDGIWSQRFAPLFRTPITDPPEQADDSYTPRRRMEPRDIAQDVLALYAPDLHTEQIRGRRGGRRLAAIRRVVIERMHASGYTGVQIARWLRIDPSRVSRAISDQRERGGVSPR